MEIAGDYLFDAPQKQVWDALVDPNVLGAVMPGGKGFEQTSENHYKGVLEVKVGPIQGIFQGEIILSDIVIPEHYQIQVDGKGTPGFVKANGTLQLEARNSQTYMVYSGQAQVGGRIASVGQRLMDSAARSIIRQSLEALNEYLKTQMAESTSPPHASEPVASTTDAVATVAAAEIPGPAKSSGEFKPSSQMMLALNVVKDVLNDLVPTKYRPWLVAAIILVIIIVVLLTRR